jgi:hypothetical protein
VKYQKEAASCTIITCKEDLCADQQETIKLQKKIDAIAARTETTRKKKAAAKAIAYDPNAIEHALGVKIATEEKLEMAKRIESDKLIQINHYAIPLELNSKAYSKFPGEHIFAVMGLPFCHSTGMGLCHKQLKILRKVLKTYGFSAAYSLSQANEAGLVPDVERHLHRCRHPDRATFHRGGGRERIRCPTSFACLSTESHAS